MKSSGRFFRPYIWIFGSISSSQELPVTPLLSLIYRNRSDLRAFADIQAPGGINKLWRWWMYYGRREYFDRQGASLAAELMKIHCVDISDFWKTGIIRPTALVMLTADLRSSRRIESEPAENTWQRWRDFFALGRTFEGSSGGLPNVQNSGSTDGQDGTHRKLPRILFAMVTKRPDLQNIGRDKNGVSKLIYWWISGGHTDFQDLREKVDRDLLQFLHLDYLPREDRPHEEPQRVPPLTPLLTIIRDQRLDLQRVVGTADDAPCRLWRWWLAAGRQEYFPQSGWLVEKELRSLHQIDARSFERTGLVAPTMLVRTLLDETDRIDGQRPTQISTVWQEFLASSTALKLPNRGRPYIANGFPGSITGRTLTFGGIFHEDFALIYTVRPDLQQKHDCRTEDGLTGLMFWWLDSGRHEYPELRQTTDAKILHSLHLQYLHGRTQDRLNQPTPLMMAIWARRDDLRTIFDIKTADGAAQMWHWWSANGEQEYFARANPLPEAELPVLLAVNSRPHEASICLIGYPKGEFGLGEDIRMLRAALDVADVDNIVIDAPWDITARQSIDEPSIDASAASFDCDVMFFVMPAFDTVTLLNKIGPHAFSARRKIGFWQWEFDRFPDHALLAMDLVDEIWCHSEHSAKAFRAATGKPVTKVPLPVFVPVPHSRPRASFDLPEQAFVVFTSFDGASAIARKNPLAAIVSFQMAFKKGGGEARLIVKAMNTRNDSLWRECLRKAATDDRIIIIESVMDRSDYLALLRNCDAVLSLHRAEGFGRLMAEAMALEIPVIATRYSGNLDFMTDDNSWLVDGTLIPVLPGDYAFYQGQQWLEPSVAAAALALQECATDEPDRKRRVARAKKDISSKYSLEACGKVYKQLLHTGPAGVG